MTAQAEPTDVAADAVRVLETARDAFVAVDEAGLVTEWNLAAEELFGWPRDEAVGHSVADLIIPESYRGQHNAGFRRLVETGEPRTVGQHTEYEALRRNGGVFPVEVTHWWTRSGGRYAFYAFIRDITERRKNELELAQYRARAAALTHQTLHDDLTGLPNRTLAVDRLGHALVDRQRRDRELAVLFVDLDRFKLVNDSLGHEAGDHLLRETATRLRAAVRPADTVARVAGDEFVVICDDLPVAAEAEEIAHRIRAAVDVPVTLDAERVHVSASVGIAVARSVGDRPEDLLRDADAAMYRAKERGGGRVAVFDEAMRQRLRNRLQLEQELVGCVDRGELRLRFRPIADVQTRRIAGVQTLVYWEHPRYGLLRPDQFLPVAEETGAVIPIGTWALSESFAQMLRWRQLGDPDLFLLANFSYRDVTQRHFIESVGEMLHDSGLDPASVLVAVTVPVMAAEPTTDPVLRMLRYLTATGARIALNHFGAGQSSVPLLRSFTPDAVRIDGSLTPGIDERVREHAIMSAMTEIGRRMGATVIADEVATAAQWHRVAEMGCDYAQGSYVGGPFPPEEAPAWLGVG